MKVTITQDDVKNLNIFMLKHSFNAKKQKLISFYAIPFEFILVGLFIDGIFKFAPIVTIVSVLLAISWLLIYPKFYNKFIQKHINNVNKLTSSPIEMNFSFDDDYIYFKNDCKDLSEEFFRKDLKKVTRTEKNYFLGFKIGHHIVLPVNDEVDVLIEQLCSEDFILIDKLNKL